MRKIVLSGALASIFAALFFFSCEENTSNFNADTGYGYYPMALGKYWVYESDSTVYDIDGSGQEVNYSSRTYIREEIIGTTVDNAGDTTFVVERTEKSNLNDGQPWAYAKTLSIKRSELRAERIQDNIRLIEMVFPPVVGKGFEATQFMDEDTEIVVAGETIKPFKGWNSEVLSVAMRDTIGNYTFPEVAVVQYADEENAIEKRYAMAKFAKNIGLAYREEWILNDQTLNDVPWEERADKGYILRQTLVSFN